MSSSRAKSLTRIGWLQGLSIPSNWIESKVKYIAPGMQAGQAITAESIEPTGTYPVYGGNGLRGYTEQKTHDGTSILIGRQGALCGNVHLVTGEYWVSEHAIVARPIDTVDERWLAYLLKVMNLGQYSQTAAQPGIGTGQINALSIPVPPTQEQRAISDYLDRETARIDTLIEEQQRLIEMLRERRQAIIDVAFSTLGEPCAQLRRYTRFLTSGSRGWGDYYADEGERFVRIGNLPRASLDLRGEVQFVDLPVDVTEGSRTMLEAGDLLFSITAYLGSVAVVDGDWIGAYVSQHVALCRLELEHVDPRFIGWYMLTTTGRDQLNEGAAGGAKMQLALDDIKGLRVPLAPINEQRCIAASLDEQTAKVDVLIAESERFIELAGERHGALITAAVMGQIDVRKAA